MHVLYLTPTYPPFGWGGIGTAVYHATRGLTMLGHQATVLCGYQQQPEDRTDDGINVAARINLNLSVAEQRHQIARETLGIIEADRVDVVELPEYRADGLEFQRRHALFPTIARLHGPYCILQPYHDGAAKSCIRRLWPRSYLNRMRSDERETIGRAAAAVSCSYWLDKLCAASGLRPPGRQVSVVRNPMLIPAEAQTPEEPRDRAVLVVGRLCRLKGTHLFPAIARRVWRDCSDVEFHLVGQGDAQWGPWIRQRLPRRFHDQVIFHGGVAHHDVLRLLPRYRVAYFASLVENCPYSHLEAMAAGLACVIASGGGAREIATDEQSAVFAPLRPTAIAAALIGLLADESRCRILGDEAQRHVNRHFGADTIMRQMLAHYERVVAQTS